LKSTNGENTPFSIPVIIAAPNSLVNKSIAMPQDNPTKSKIDM